MESIREQVKAMLLTKGYEKVMIRPNGQIRLLESGEWTDGGMVGMYAADIAAAARAIRVSADDAHMMETGYGQID